MIASFRRNQRVLIFFTLIFSLFVIALVVLADRGEIDNYMGFLIDLPYADKVGHFFLIGLLAFLVNLCLAAKTFSVRGWRFLVGSAWVTAIVSAEELSQGFIPSRTLSLGDWLADIAGIILFGQLAACLAGRLRRTEKRQA